MKCTNSSNRIQPTNCQFVLDKIEPLIFSVGDAVNGQLIFKVSKPLFTSAIRVVLEGTAVVQDKAKPLNSGTFYKTEAKMLEHVGEKPICRKGEYRLHFQFLRLRPLHSGQLPGTMQTSHGSIQYQLVAYTKQENNNRKGRKVAEKTIVVCSHLNLSAQESSLMTRIVYEKTEQSKPSTFGSLLRVALRLKRSGFLAEESILFELELHNPARYEITMGGVTLVQKIMYDIGHSHKIQLFELRSLETMEALQCHHGRSKAVWMDQIIIPGEILSSQSGGIIGISHYLKIRIMTSSANGPFIMEAPLIIGTTK